MNAAFKGDVHSQSDNSSNSEDEDVEVDNFEEEAAVEDAIPEEPCIERAVEDYDDLTANLILHLRTHIL